MSQVWTLETARAFVADHQAWSMENGYYIALAGGVLNKGESDNDLDLVFVPRWQYGQDALSLIRKFQERLGGSSSVTERRTGWLIRFPKLKVEALVIECKENETVADIKPVEELQAIAARVRAEKNAEEAERLFEEAKTAITEAASRGKYVASLKCDSEEVGKQVAPRLEALGLEAEAYGSLLYVTLPRPEAGKEKSKEALMGCLFLVALFVGAIIASVAAEPDIAVNFSEWLKDRCYGSPTQQHVPPPE